MPHQPHDRKSSFARAAAVAGLLRHLGVPGKQMPAHLIAGSLLLIMIGGCSGQAVPAASIASAQQSFDNGVASFDFGDYAEADKALTEALSSGGLNPDLTSEAYLKRAESRIELKMLAEAEEDLKIVAEAAPDPSHVFLLKSKLFLVQGDPTRAKQAFAEAKKLNPRLKMPDGL